MKFHINKLFYIIIFFIMTPCYCLDNIQIKDVSKNNKKLTLEILLDNKKIQTIKYNYPKDTFEDSVFNENKYEYIDVNFDGNKDLLIYLGTYGNQGIIYKDCYLWNNTKKKFEHFELLKNIPNLKIDESEKCIYGYSKINSGHYIYNYYVWENNSLICKYCIHKVESAMQLNDIYNINIPKDLDAGEYILQYYKLKNSLYNSTFYILINLKENKTSDPMLDIPNEVPVTLQKLIKEK